MTLTPADVAAVGLAVRYAARIDAATASGSSEDLTKVLFLGPHLLRVLESLGGTPAGRKASRGSTRQPAGGRLALLRVQNQARDAG